MVLTLLVVSLCGEGLATFFILLEIRLLLLFTELLPVFPFHAAYPFRCAPLFSFGGIFRPQRPAPKHPPPIAVQGADTPKPPESGACPTGVCAKGRPGLCKIGLLVLAILLPSKANVNRFYSNSFHIKTQCFPPFSHREIQGNHSKTPLTKKDSR